MEDFNKECTDDESLYNFILTHKSVNHKTPYDDIEAVIENSIVEIKQKNINAKITNLIFNIDSKLVPAQIYVERQNGFATAKDNRFGTSPTSYNVQLRFPFGMEMKLGQDLTCLPSGDFENVLQPYYSGHRDNPYVLDDVHRDTEPNQIVHDNSIQVSIKNSTVSLRCEPNRQHIEFPFGDELGQGWRKKIGCVPPDDKEYSSIAEHEARFKMKGVYPLFYFSKNKPHIGLLRQHIEYADQACDQFLVDVNRTILNSETGQYWNTSFNQKNDEAYVFNITIVNGVTLLTKSGLPVIRLRDYQLELFHHCLDFIKIVDQQNRASQLKPGLSGIIDMGVGAGKTFCIFTLLQHIKYAMQAYRFLIAPAFCTAPDEVIAKVIEQSINHQGSTTGTSAISITNRDKIPGAAFLEIYQKLARIALIDAEKVDRYINNELQTEILDFCHQNELHPNRILALLSDQYAGQQLADRMSLFKESMDVKRLLLLVEGHKTIMTKTGMLGVTALYDLLEQFKTLEEGLNNATSSPLLSDIKENTKEIPSSSIRYDRIVPLPPSMQSNALNGINIAKISPEQLKNILTVRYPDNLSSIRDVLIRIACMQDKEAAILLANSGGLGNTYTSKELERQIDRFLPIATKLVTTLAKQPQHSLKERLMMHSYLNVLFSTIPSELDFKDRHNLTRHNYVEALKDNLKLVTQIKEKIQHKISTLQKANQVPGIDPNILIQFGIRENASAIEAANQLAGIASLQITGSVEGNNAKDNAKLLLTHIPVFTPEGLSSYFEHLASLKDTGKAVFQEKYGVYGLTEPETRVSEKDIQVRLQQILNAVMIADEVHHKEFEFLYDTNHPIYKRINNVTLKFLKKPFIDVLPHRIGMSGTINGVAKNAFPGENLYNLTTQKMIQKRLIKQVSVDTFAVQPPPEQEVVSDTQLKQTYAKQIVIDYFMQNSHLSIKNLLDDDYCGVDLFALSKGLIFSKVADEELNGYVVHSFNLLSQDAPQGDDQALQQELFGRINEARRVRAEQLQRKLEGQAALSQVEIEQIEHYNRTNVDRSIQIAEGKITNPSHKSVRVMELNSKEIQRIHRDIFLNNLFALYLEYVLSKSTAPKELSDIIGLQNILHETGFNLFDIHLVNNHKEVTDILSLIKNVDPKSMTLEDIHKFLNERIRDDQGHMNAVLREQLKVTFLKYKNNCEAFIHEALHEQFCGFPLAQLITTNREQFESGTTLAMVGSRRECTGYSHELVGIIMDISSDISNMLKLNQNIEQLRTQQLLQADAIQAFFASLQTLVTHTFSYDEKNQAGGRALRTPYGHVKYVQYLTGINHFIQTQTPENQRIVSALKLETSFEEIFTSNEQLAQEERASITFNRKCFSLLSEKFENPAAFSQVVRTHFVKELGDPLTQKTYQDYIKERLPLLWAMKYHPDIAAAYLAQPNHEILNQRRLVQDNPIPVSPIQDNQVSRSNIAEMNQLPSNSLIEARKKSALQLFRQNPIIATINEIHNAQPVLAAIIMEQILLAILEQICNDYEAKLYNELSKTTRQSLSNGRDQLSIQRLKDQKERFGFWGRHHTKDKPTIHKLIALKELKQHLNCDQPNKLDAFQRALMTQKAKLEERRINLLLAVCTFGLSVLLPMIFNKVQGENVTETMQHGLITFRRCG
jgi:hypothetical protein